MDEDDKDYEEELLSTLSESTEENNKSLYILLLILLSKSNSQLALALSISSTANHVERILFKAREDGHNAAIAYLISQKIIKQSSNNTYKPTDNNLADIKSKSTTIVSSIVAKIISGPDKEVNQTSIINSVNDSKKKIDQIISDQIFQQSNDTTVQSIRETNPNQIIVYRAELDKRTCSKCYSLDGNTYRAKDELPSIPAHSRCRCYWATE